MSEAQASHIMGHAINAHIHVGNQLLIIFEGFHITGIGKLSGLGIVVFGSYIIRNTLLVQCTQVMSARPLILIAFGNRHNTGCLDRIQHLNEIIPGLRGLQSQIVEHIYIVEEFLGIQTEGNSVYHAVGSSVLVHLGLHQAGLPFRIRFQIGGQIHEQAFTDEALGELTAEAEEDVRAFIRSDYNLDLLFVGLILCAGHLELDVRMLSLVLSNLFLDKSIARIIREAMEQLDCLNIPAGSSFRLGLRSCTPCCFALCCCCVCRGI